MPRLLGQWLARALSAHVSQRCTVEILVKPCKPVSAFATVLSADMELVRDNHMIKPKPRGERSALSQWPRHGGALLLQEHGVMMWPSHPLSLPPSLLSSMFYGWGWTWVPLPSFLALLELIPYVSRICVCSLIIFSLRKSRHWYALKQIYEHGQWSWA